MEYVSPRQTSGPRPWSALPPELPGILAPAVPPLAAELMTLLPQQVPAYAAATEGRYWEKLARGVDIALARLVALPGTDEPALNEESRRLVSGLGTGEFREGRSMDSLLAAYRAGARLAFRVLSEECLDAGMSPAVTISLGESIWAYIDELSSVSAQAYAAELSAQAGLRERRHAELLETLLRGGADDVEIRRLATAADWRLPSRIAVVVLPTVAAARARLQLGATGLVVERDSEATALVAAPERPHHETRLLRMLARTEAVVGPPVDWSDAPHSHRVAQFLASRRARRIVHAPDEERAPSVPPPAQGARSEALPVQGHRRSAADRVDLDAALPRTSRTWRPTASSPRSTTSRGASGSARWAPRTRSRTPRRGVNSAGTSSPRTSWRP